MMLLCTGFENMGLRWWFTASAARVDSMNTTMTSDRTQNCCFHGPVHTSAKGLKDPEVASITQVTNFKKHRRSGALSFREGEPGTEAGENHMLEHQNFI